LIALPVDVDLVSFHMACEGLAFVESGKTNFSLLLSGFTIGLGFDSVQSYLLGVILVWTLRSSIASEPVSAASAWTASDTTSTERIEAPAEE
jgi:hypothetical protein